MRWRARRQIAEPGQAARGAGGNSAASRSPTFSPELWLLPGGAAGWMACGCLALCSAGPGQAKQRVALAAQVQQGCIICKRLHVSRLFPLLNRRVQAKQRVPLAANVRRWCKGLPGALVVLAP